MEQHVALMLIVGVGSLALLGGMMIDIYLHLRKKSMRERAESLLEDMSDEERERIKKRVERRLRELSY